VRGWITPGNSAAGAGEFWRVVADSEPEGSKGSFNGCYTQFLSCLAGISRST